MNKKLILILEIKLISVYHEISENVFSFKKLSFVANIKVKNSTKYDSGKIKAKLALIISLQKTNRAFSGVLKYNRQLGSSTLKNNKNLFSRKVKLKKYSDYNCDGIEILWRLENLRLVEQHSRFLKL